MLKTITTECKTTNPNDPTPSNPHHPYHRQGGWLSMESITTYGFYMIMIGAVAAAIVLLYSSSKLSEVEQLLSSMRMETLRVFAGSTTFTGLDNDFALKSGIIPSSRVRGSVARNPWGGELQVSPSDGDSSLFNITMDNVPEKDCASLSMFQAGAWESVTINGTTVTQDDGVATASTACSGSDNSMTFTAR